MGVVFHYPIHRIAGQSVLAVQRDNTTIFQVAEPTLSPDPERTGMIELKAADTPFAEPIGGCVRCSDLTISEIGDTTQEKSNPYTTLQTISGENTGMVL